MKLIKKDNGKYYTEDNRYRVNKFLSFGNETFWTLKEINGSFEKTFRTLKQVKEYLIS